MEEPVISSRTARWGSYAVAFLITALIFATALYVSNYFNTLRIADIRATQDDISTDILSLETQFDLLEQHSCSDIAENTILPSELTNLGNQLAFVESRGPGNQDEVMRLKRLYSLLEIKDYLLMKRVAEKCSLKPVFILYFYSNKGDCEGACQKQGDVLTALSQTYPQLRIYSFDYNLQVSALQTLIDINNIGSEMPALVINEKTYHGFQSMDQIRDILPQLATLKKNASPSPATSTK